MTSRILQLGAFVALLFGFSACKTTSGTPPAGSEVRSVGVANEARGQKDVYHLKDGTVHFWRCTVDANGGPYVRDVGMSGMDSACPIHRAKTEAAFRQAWQSAYLAGQNRALTPAEKWNLDYLFGWMASEMEAGWKENGAWYRPETAAHLGVVTKLLAAMPRAMDMTPIAVSTQTLSGYDFGGPTSCEPLPAGWACPMIATAESDACYEAGGQTSFCRGCGVICDRPIQLPSEEISGYDLNGPTTCNALPTGWACPMIATPESDACYAAGGQTSFCEGCKVICDKPMTASGETINGFDFDGPTTCEALPAGWACPMVATAESDACWEAGGQTRFCKGCGTICSKPISQAGETISGYNFTGATTCEALPSGWACPQIATPESDACWDVGGQERYCKGCGVLCSKPISP